ncbi:substrate-binding domain-containing protein [Pseudooceanicola sp. CBS1P-1]|uniref:Substrate-binding domain-containing protein n=1 Tax=Pseudooceanicola albus TaxID=2692189 RepID=A0A6L7G0H5_9RHOB|nr:MULTISPECIES: substrate-binding domain-containing protein [Pseudooceanicola]MBT9383737.1 substrate-binding domain-containing protein [Pseudooceanicola endophyticus]MXN17591.1 substrate-binding domain-containing protein [Pseudooceanicola albus]
MRRLLGCVAIAALHATGAGAQTTIGVTLADASFAFVKGLEAAYAARDDVQIVLKDAKGDGALQVKQVEEFVAAGVDAIIVNPIQPDNGIATTMAAGKVPLVYVNQEPINSSMLPAGQGYVGSNETESGTLEMTEVCRLMGGKGVIAVLIGNLETNAARVRTEAVHSVLDTSECKGISAIIEGEAFWEPGPAETLVAGWLADGLTFDAIVSNNDAMAHGALKALKAAGIGPQDMIVAGIDGTPDTLAALATGDFDVTVFQNAAGQANGSVDLAKRFVEGDTAEQFLWVPFELVTPENRANYMK